jgi:acetate kinase
MSAVILALNVGSSSIKFALFDDPGLKPLLRGTVDAIGGDAHLRLDGPRAEALQSARPPVKGEHAQIAAWLVRTLAECLPDLSIRAAGHRVVHGGATFGGPIRIDAQVLDGITALIPLAPNHQPQALAAIRAVAAQWPELPQVACFDTAFHRTQPRLAQLFALPRALSDAGILRYGFHGLSYEYIADALPQVAGPVAEGRVIVAHLGHGASLCAMRARRSVATTMGFTVIDGLMMGRRCGRLDPGVVLHLQQQLGMDAATVADLLNNRSGLLGVSGISDDVRTLEASDDPHARQALDLFAYRAAGEIGALAATLQGVDALVFTGGIGEHSVRMRESIVRRCRWLGAVLDNDANEAQATRLHAETSRVGIWRIPTDEETVVARSVSRALEPATA